MADKTLDTLVRLSKFEVDERQRELQILLTHEDKIKAAIRALDDEMRNEAEFSREHGDRSGTDYGQYIIRVRDKREKLIDQLTELHPKIEAARDRLADAFAEQKKYEIARDNRAAEEAAEASRKEDQEMDELGLSGYRRKEAENNR